MVALSEYAIKSKAGTKARSLCMHLKFCNTFIAVYLRIWGLLLQSLNSKRFLQYRNIPSDQMPYMKLDNDKYKFK